jgi:putative transcriptional regulator
MRQNIPPYVPLNIDYKKLTINGVPFPNLQELKDTAAGITSNMYEGFRPTPKIIEIVRDRSQGKISYDQLVEIAKNGTYT